MRAVKGWVKGEQEGKGLFRRWFRKGIMQGLLDEVEFLQNHLGFLDLNEVSEELPNRGAEIRQLSQDGLHCTGNGL